MKVMLIAVVAMSLLPGYAFASSYTNCVSSKTKTTAEFHFKDGVPTEATMTYQGDFHESDMMLQFMEDYQEVAGKSLYVQVAMVTASLIFDLSPNPENPDQWIGKLHVFGHGPMTTEALTCDYSPTAPQ